MKKKRNRQYCQEAIIKTKFTIEKKKQTQKEKENTIMYVSRLLKSLIFVLAFAAVVVNYAYSSPLMGMPSETELNDLNKLREKSRAAQEESSSFTPYDEDSLHLVANLNQDKSFKYDVEMLEARDIKEETEELEERFRGSAIKMDTDNIVAENIEVNDGVTIHANDDDDVKPNHMILTLVLIFVTLFSISLYVALVMWRSHLERRYGMRELLVTDDDDFYLPSSEPSTNQR